MQWKDDTTLPSRGQPLRAMGKSRECSRRPLGFGDAGSMSGLPESWHSWAIYE